MPFLRLSPRLLRVRMQPVQRRLFDPHMQQVRTQLVLRLRLEPPWLLMREQMAPRLLLDPGLQVVRTEAAGPVTEAAAAAGRGSDCGIR